MLNLHRSVKILALGINAIQKTISSFFMAIIPDTGKKLNL